MFCVELWKKRIFDPRSLPAKQPPHAHQHKRNVKSTCTQITWSCSGILRRLPESSSSSANTPQVTTALRSSSACTRAAVLQPASFSSSIALTTCSLTLWHTTQHKRRPRVGHSLPQQQHCAQQLLQPQQRQQSQTQRHQQQGGRGQLLQVIGSHQDLTSVPSALQAAIQEQHTCCGLPADGVFGALLSCRCHYHPLQRRAGPVDAPPVWTLDQIAGLAFGVSARQQQQLHGARRLAGVVSVGNWIPGQLATIQHQL